MKIYKIICFDLPDGFGLYTFHGGAGDFHSNRCYCHVSTDR